MGTLKDTINQAIEDDNWCVRGAAIIATRPDDPSDYYDACDTAPGFLQVLNITNRAKAKAMFLQSILELVSDMDACEEKTRLDTIGQETATLADEVTWAAANPDGTTECRNLVAAASKFLDDAVANSKTGWDSFDVFVRARAEVDGPGIGTIEADAALLTLWKDRCPLDEWKNGLT